MFPFDDVIMSVGTGQNFQAGVLSDFHNQTLSTARAWDKKFSSRGMQVYIGDNRFLGSNHIASVFHSSQLSFDTCNTFNHHLVPDS